MVDEVKGDEQPVEEVEEQPVRGVYELGFHIVPTVSEQDVATHASEIKTLIEEQGGSVIAEEAPRSLSLAYPILKAHAGKRVQHRSAFFGWIKFEIESSKLAGMKVRLAECEWLLRHLLFITVREDTRAPKRVLAPKPETVRPRAPVAPASKPVVRKEEKSGPVSEEELDRTIEKLVVE